MVRGFVPHQVGCPGDKHVVERVGIDGGLWASPGLPGYLDLRSMSSISELCFGAGWIDGPCGSDGDERGAGEVELLGEVEPAYEIK